MRLAHATWARTTIVVALLAAMFWFASTRLAAGASRVDASTLRENIPLLALAVLLFMFGTLLLGIGWIAVLESIAPGEPRRRAPLLLAFSYSWLGRYVPGTVPFFAGKVYLGTRLGYEVRPLIVSTAVQNVLEVLVCTVFGAMMLTASLGVGSGSGLYIALTVFPAVGLVALHPKVLRRIVDASLRLMRRDALPAGGLPPTRALVLSAAFVTSNQAINGIVLLTLLHVVADASWADAFLVTGALSLAGVAGILVVFVPAGLGVRDGALGALLGTRFAVESAALASVFLRLLSVVADLLLFASAFVIDRLTRSGVATRALRREREPRPPIPLTTPAVTHPERRAA